MSYFSVTPQFGDVAYTVVTHSTAATADTVITLSSHKRVLTITSTLDKAVIITKGGADFHAIPPNTVIGFDLGPSEMQFASGSVLGVYHRGVAPTQGNLSITAL